MARTWFIALSALVAVAATAPASLASNDDIKARARAIEQKAAIGQYEEAWRDLGGLEALLWEKRPLGVSAALFVQKPAKGYGLYEPRESAEFSGNQPIVVYLQPVGYGYERSEDLFRNALTADFELRTPTGQVLAEQEAFSRLSLESRAPNREFQASFSFTFEGLEPGRYALLIRLRDQNGGQRSETSLPFTIVAAPDEEKSE